MRKKQKKAAVQQQQNCVLSTPVVVTLTAQIPKGGFAHANLQTNTPSTPTPSKQVLENNRKKRRSSFAVMAAQNQSARSSTIGVTLTHQMPPESVAVGEYHRHLLPDMPGPVKMRQMMIWACQKASLELTTSKSSSSNDNKNSLKQDLNEFKDELVQALFKNEITTSWYQRPPKLENGHLNTNNSISGSLNFIPNPQNQELSECIDLYKNYQMKLERECATWKDLKANYKSSLLSLYDDIKQQQNTENNHNHSNTNNNHHNHSVDNTLNILFADEFSSMNKWLNSLPLSVDRFDWNTKLAISFQDHSKQFCEGVFHQIFAKFFSSDLRGTKSQKIEPMMVLRAMSQPTIPDSPINFLKK